MDRLVVGLSRCGPVLIGRILFQDESLRLKDDDLPIIKVSECGQFNIRSSGWPSISPHTLWIRGTDRRSDDRIFYYNYGDYDMAKEALKMFKHMIAGVNECEIMEYDGNGLEVIK